MQKAPVNLLKNSLLLADNEGNAAGWKAKQSLALIRFYDPEYESDEEAQSTSPRRRVKLASCLGFTPSQLLLGYKMQLWGVDKRDLD
ncbi:hypothetical protein QOT17_004104 [Balamuthia mandrillaris]